MFRQQREHLSHFVICRWFCDAVPRRVCVLYTSLFVPSLSSHSQTNNEWMRCQKKILIDIFSFSSLWLSFPALPSDIFWLSWIQFLSSSDSSWLAIEDRLPNWVSHAERNNNHDISESKTSLSWRRRLFEISCWQHRGMVEHLLLRFTLGCRSNRQCLIVSRWRVSSFRSEFPILFRVVD